MECGRQWTHTLHLGLSPKVNNVQGAIWLRLAREGQKRAVEGGGSGWREGLQRTQAYGKADFSSPCSSQRRQMSVCAASTLDCAALGTTTWPSLLSHRVWAAVTLWSLSPGQRKASRCSGLSTCTHVNQHLLHSLPSFTQEMRLAFTEQYWNTWTNSPESLKMSNVCIILIFC